MRNIRIFLFSFFACIPAIALCAHGTSFAAKPGQVDFSTYWVVTSGVDQNMALAMDANNTIIGYSYDEVISRQNAGIPGVISMAELTVAPGFSLGLIINVPQFLISGLQGGDYNICAAVTMDWKWYRGEFLTLGSRLEVEAAPLFGAPEIRDQGFYNFYATPMSVSYELVRKGSIALNIYGDAKAITSLINTAYRSYENDFANYLRFDNPSALNDLPHSFGPAYKLFFAPGLEAQFKNFYLSLGYKSSSQGSRPRVL